MINKNQEKINVQSYDELTKQIGRFVLLAVNSELIRYTDKYTIDDFLKKYKGTTEARAITMIQIAADVYKTYDIDKLNIY
jgi:hypothetical protein